MKRWIVCIMAFFLAGVMAVAPETAQSEETLPQEGILYTEDFESGAMDGWVSYEDKSGIVETEEGHAYCVRSYDYNSKTETFSDYEFRFDMKIDYKEPGTTAPSIYVRRGSDGNRYEMYIDSAAGKMVVDRVVHEEKTNIGEVTADFYADRLQWVTMKIVVSGKNIWIYYGDMETPAAKLRDETPLVTGGIGFGFGNADFYVDNITITELSEPIPEPYEIDPEEQKDYKDSPYKEEIDRLIAFGIVTAFEDGTFRPENAITRAEFAALVMRARNVENAAGGSELSFSDVDPESWAVPAISTVCAMGYMCGTSGDTFAPNDPITMEQAAKVLVKMIGGDVLAEWRGGYPSGYLSYAAQSGVTKGVEKSAAESLTRGEVAKLFANTIELDILKQTGFGDMEEYVTQKDVTILSEYHSIYPRKGRITANYYAGIVADEPLAKNEVMLENEILDKGATDAADWLGYYGKAYIRLEASEPLGEMVYFSVDTQRSEALVIAADDLLQVDEMSELSYRDSETGKTRTVQLFKNTNLIYNGGSGTFSEDNLLPETGSVTLLDTDGDSRYDVALVESYETLAVGNLSPDSGKITDLYDPLKVVETKDLDLFVRRGYQEIALEDIAPLEVVSIAKTEARAAHQKMTILASEKKVQGKITEYETGEGNGSVTIKGKRYPLSAYLRQKIDEGAAEELRVGATATLRLDHFGCIGIAQMSQSSDFMLLNGIMWEQGADSGWLAELFLSNGEWQTAKLSSSLLYNGAALQLAQDNLPEELNERQIVKIKFNSQGKVVSLDTAQAGSGVLARSRVYEDWPMEFISSTMSFDTDSYVDEDTLVFTIPYETADKSGYQATNSSYFQNGSTYRLWSYNEDSYEVADIILVFEKKDSGGNGKYARPFFFIKSTKAIDADGLEVTKINGYQNGEQVSYVLAQEVQPDFACGDALIFSTNAAGEVVAYQFLYRTLDGRVGSNNDQFGMSSDRVTVAGTVLDFDAASGRLLLDVGAEEKREKAFLISKAYSVYCCQQSKEKIYLTTIREINPGDFVVMDFSWNELRDIMIYR